MAGILSIKIRADATPFERSLKTVGRNITSFAQKSLAVGRGISLGFTAPLMAIGGTAVRAAADFDALERALQGIMGGANAAASEMGKLKEAAKLPGLGFEEAVRGSVQLQAVGLNADEARKSLIGFGTAISASGGGVENFAGVNRQLVQMIAKNRILNEDFRIMQEHVPIISKALENAFGTKNIEAIRDTGISAKDFTMRLVAALQALPEVQAATGSLRNDLDNFKDSLKFAQVELGKAILKNIDLEKVLKSVTETIEHYLTIWGNLSDGTKQLIVDTTKYIAIGGGLAWIIGQITSAVGVLTMALGKLMEFLIDYNKVTGVVKLTTGGWITIALAAAAAIGAFAYSVHQANKPFDDLSKTMSASAKEVKNEINLLNQQFAIINSSNTSQKLRSKLITEIFNKYESYLPDLKDEKELTNDLASAQEKLNIQLGKKFELIKLQGVSKAQEAKSLELLQKEEELKIKILKIQKEIRIRNATALDKPFFNWITGLSGKLEDANSELKKTQAESKKIEAAWTKTNEAIQEILGTIPQITPGTGNGNGNDGLIGNLDKEKTRYELLTDSLDKLNEQYENQVLLYGRNSEGAKVLENNIRNVRFEIERVKKALEDLEKLGSFNPFEVLKNKKLQIKEAEELRRQGEKEVIDLLKGDIEASLTGSTDSLDKFLDFKRKDAAFPAMAQMLENPFPKAEEQLSKLQQQMEELKGVIYDIGVALQNSLGGVLSQSFEALGQSLANGENAVLAFGKTFVSVMLDAVNSALQLLLVDMVSNALKNAKGLPVASILAVGLGIAAVSFLKSKMNSVKLAKGGLAFGPTNAVVGDNIGSSYDPEVIAPLSKLKGMLGDIGGGEPYVLTTKVAGSDLLVIMEKARNINTRIR